MPAGRDSQVPFLEAIVASKRKEIPARKAQVPLPELQARVRDLPPARDFRGAISRGGGRGGAGRFPIRLIAEIKRASPSQGLLREHFASSSLARGYEHAGASALSVLTDAPFFQGSLAYLEEVKARVALPVLQKDFLLEAYQVWEGRAWGADAVLLIATLMDRGLLRDLVLLAREVGLQALVEIHHEKDLEKALAADSDMIGINNRDLLTFRTDLHTTFGLLGAIPEGKVVVSESGISSREEVIQLERAGLDALLVGEALMRSDDPGAKLKELLGSG